MDKLQKMILKKTIYNVQHLKRYSVPSVNTLLEKFNQPQSKFKLLVKNQTVSKLYLLINIDMFIIINIFIFMFRDFFIHQS